MNKKRIFLFSSTCLLNKFSMVSMIFIMVFIPLFRQQIFIDRENFSSIELMILLGLLSVFLFLIFSLAFLYLEIRESNGCQSFQSWKLFTLGTICLFLFIAEKVIVDEIAHEYIAGWPVLGEWMILYLIFTIHLIYHLLIFFHLKNSMKKNIPFFSKQIC